jgi:hypothetical protein
VDSSRATAGHPEELRHRSPPVRQLVSPGESDPLQRSPGPPRALRAIDGGVRPDRSTAARRLSTLTSFYRYCEQEGIVERTWRSTSAGRSWTTSPGPSGSTATSWAPSSSRPGWGRLATTPWPLRWPSTGCGSPRRSAPTYGEVVATRELCSSPPAWHPRLPPGVKRQGSETTRRSTEVDNS